jgi:hypothetical protein
MEKSKISPVNREKIKHDKWGNALNPETEGYSGEQLRGFEKYPQKVEPKMPNKM